MTQSSIEVYLPYLDWIDLQYERMVTLLEQWANINSSSDNLEGLEIMRHKLLDAFSSLGGDFTEHLLPPRVIIDDYGNPLSIPSAKALSLIKRSTIRPRILLGGHFDTVYPISNPFQKTERISKDILKGPGVADMKGGLVIMLIALEAFERSPWASRVGWQVFFNPDEEIGSPGSSKLIRESALEACLGLIFEPAVGELLANQRKGSMNYTLVVRGKSAHAGRDMHLGRNAIYAMSHFIHLLERCNDPHKGITVNVGKIRGGEAVNVVPDLAICRFTIRMVNVEDLAYMRTRLSIIIAECVQREGIIFQLHEDSCCQPKLLEGLTATLCNKIEMCGKDLEIPIHWCISGGVSDGNRLAEVGLPTVDNLGVVGGHIHSSEEFVYLPSLITRAKLAALFLMKGDYV